MYKNTEITTIERIYKLMTFLYKLNHTYMEIARLLLLRINFSHSIHLTTLFI